MTIHHALDVKFTPTPKRRPDVTIAIMGPTGTGKSSFIRLITGNKDIQVGHGVHSMTSEIGLFRYSEKNGRCVTFVDTPGFDDSHEGETDTDVLKKIASFLDSVEFKSKKLTGIIYLHRITDPRMGGISIRNMRTFRKLCGEGALRNVVVVTTRWDDVLEADREAMGRREKELMETEGKFFEPLIAAGGRFFRHDNTFESASRVMEKVSDNDAVALQIQVEMDKGMMLGETAAGVELAVEMKKLIAKHSNEMGYLQKEMAAAIAEKDEMLRKELEAGRIKLEREIQKQEEAKKQMERDLDSANALATKEEEERRTRLQREELVGNLQKVEERTENERKQLKAVMDKMAESNRSLESRMRQIDAAKRNMDYENQRRLEHVQRQMDQARREKEESERQYQRLFQRRYS